MRDLLMLTWLELRRSHLLRHGKHQTKRIHVLGAHLAHRYFQVGDLFQFQEDLNQPEGID